MVVSASRGGLHQFLFFNETFLEEKTFFSDELKKQFSDLRLALQNFMKTAMPLTSMFNPNLIFVGKAESLPLVWSLQEGLHSGGLPAPALLANVRLGWKGLTLTSALCRTSAKGFIVQVTGWPTGV
jgi:hypothetical protein